MSISSSKLVCSPPKSVLALVDKHMRLRCSISARIDGLIDQYRYNLSGRVDSDYLKAVLELELLALNGFLIRLDNNNLICNTQRCFLSVSSINDVYSEVRNAWKLYPSDLNAHCIKLFGSFSKFNFDDSVRINSLISFQRYLESVGKDTSRVESDINLESGYLDFERSYIRQLTESCRLARVAELKSRLACDMEYRVSKGWFMVFNTLTVNNNYINLVFGKDSTYWTDYIRSVDRLFARASFGSYRNALNANREDEFNEYHSYFAVVEQGGRTGRLHIHVLHLFRDLPSSFSDPNRGLSQPYLREIVAMKRFWKCGKSVPIAVRNSAFDAFSKKGWIWPVMQVPGDNGFSYQPVPEKPVVALASYISKYITKSYNRTKREKEGCIWRTRISRNLSKMVLKSQLLQMSKKNRLYLLLTYKAHRKFLTTSVPRRKLLFLLLKMISKESIARMYRRALFLPVRNMFKLLRSMIRGKLVYSLPSFGSTVISNMRGMVVSNYFKVTSWSLTLKGVSYVV